MIEFGKGKIVFKVGKPTNIPLCCQLQSTHVMCENNQVFKSKNDLAIELIQSFSSHLDGHEQVYVLVDAWYTSRKLVVDCSDFSNSTGAEKFMKASIAAGHGIACN
jgi:hypothetical protein